MATDKQINNIVRIKCPCKNYFNALPLPAEEVGFFLCSDCIYHRCVYFKLCKSFQFKVNNKFII